MKRLKDFAHNAKGKKMFYHYYHHYFSFFLSRQQHRQVSAFRGNMSQNLPIRLHLLLKEDEVHLGLLIKILFRVLRGIKNLSQI